MSLLEQDTIKKKQVDKKEAEQLEFKARGDNKKYKVESISNIAVYIREFEMSHL